MSDLELKGIVSRSSSDEVRIYQGKSGKYDVVDIRWYLSDKASKKGVRVNLNEFRQLHSILTDVLQEIDEDVETKE